MDKIVYNFDGQPYISSGDKAKDIRFLSEKFPNKDFKEIRSIVYKQFTGEAPKPANLKEQEAMRKSAKAEHYLGPQENVIPSLGIDPTTYGENVINALTFGQYPALTAVAQAAVPSLAKTPQGQEYIGGGSDMAERYQRAKELQDLAEARSYEANPKSAFTGSLVGAMGGAQNFLTNKAYQAMFGAAPTAAAEGANYLSRLGTAIKEGAKYGTASIPVLNTMLPANTSLEDRAAMSAASPAVGGVVGGAFSQIPEAFNLGRKMVGSASEAVRNAQIPEILSNYGFNIPNEYRQVGPNGELPISTRILNLAKQYNLGKGSFADAQQKAQAAKEATKAKRAGMLEGKYITTPELTSAIKTSTEVPDDLEASYLTKLQDILTAGIKKRFTKPTNEELAANPALAKKMNWTAPPKEITPEMEATIQSNVQKSMPSESVFQKIYEEELAKAPKDLLGNPQGIAPFADWQKEFSKRYVDNATTTARNKILAGEPLEYGAAKASDVRDWYDALSKFAKYDAKNPSANALAYETAANAGRANVRNIAPGIEDVEQNVRALGILTKSLSEAGKKGKSATNPMGGLQSTILGSGLAAPMVGGISPAQAAATAIGTVGGKKAVENMAPYLARKMAVPFLNAVERGIKFGTDQSSTLPPDYLFTTARHLFTPKEKK